MNPNPLFDVVVFITQPVWTTAVFWLLALTSVLIAAFVWHRFAEQRTPWNFVQWSIRFVMGAFWWQQSLWKLPPFYTDHPEAPFGETGLAYWMGLMGKHAAIPLQADFVNYVVLPHFYWFAPLVYILEVLTGVSLMFGAFVRLFAIIGALQILNLWLGLYSAPGEWPWTYFFLFLLQLAFAVHCYGRSLGIDAVLDAGVAAGIRPVWWAACSCCGVGQERDTHLSADSRLDKATMNILLQRHRRDGEARQRPYRADHHEPDRQGQFPRAHGARVVDDGRAKRRDRAQIEGAVIFGITAALHGEITLKNGRVEQANFDSYPMLRIDEAPAIEVYIVPSTEPPGGMGEPGTFRDRPRGHQHDFHGDRQAHTQAAGRGGLVEAPSLNQHSEQLTTAQSHPLQYYRPIGATPVRSYLPYSPRRDVR